MPFDYLFSPVKISTLELKNRIVMPAMGTEFAGEDGEVTDTLINWYARRAEGGASLIIVEICSSATAIDPMPASNRSLRADDRRYIAGLERLAEAIHIKGAKAAIQLSAGRGAQSKGGTLSTGEKSRPPSPSGVPGLGHKDQPRVLTEKEIHQIVELCGNAANNVKQAGFDLIEIHAHGGYLIAQFLSPYFNKRTDNYGGSLENRCRFLMEIIAAMRNAVGPDFPITVKYSIEDFLPRGWDIEQSRFLAKKLEASGINGIGISSGVHGTKMPAAPPYFYPPGILLPFAEAIKKEINLPIFVGGRLNDPHMANRAIRDGKTNFIYEGRALIADPDWPNKVAGGRIREIRPCLYCNECRQFVVTKQPLRCTVNATAGKEGEYNSISPAEVKKTVLVAGGGPAGMEAARIAALKGHRVILCERTDRLGGIMLLAGIHNEEITTFVKWLVSQVRELPVEIRLKTEVTPALADEIKPDVVILATGGTFVTPEIPGIYGNNVFSTQDLLKLINGNPIKKGALMSFISLLARNFISISTVRRLLSSNFLVKRMVAVIGGQFPGCSLALLLAHKGKMVTVIEESECFGKDMEAHTMVSLNAEAEAGNVKILTSTHIDEINDKNITLTDTQGNKISYPADTVIVALEPAPSDANLFQELTGRVEEIYEIGDARSFGRIRQAISDGYTTAYCL